MTIENINSTESPPALPEFERESRMVLAQLRTAISELFSVTPGGIRRAIDIQKTLGTDNKTSWRLFKLASASDPLSVGMHVPGRPSIKRAMDAAAKHAVPAPTIQAVLDAFDAFEKLVDRYAGNRTTFDSMVSAYGDDDDAQIDLMHRRAAFRANSHLIGIRSDAQMITYILFPNRDEPDMLDVALIQGSYGLLRLRRHISWPVATASAAHAGGELIIKDADPLNNNEPDRLGLITEFSDHPRSELRVRPGPPGKINIDLVGDSVGIPSASTCLFGHITRAIAPWSRTPTDEDLNLYMHIITPTELLQANVILHENTFGRPEPRTAFRLGMGHTPGSQPLDKHPPVDLPIRSKAACIGRGHSALHTPKLPRYAELMRRAFDQAGLDPEEFVVYQLHTEFPPVSSTAVFQIPLPEPRA